MPDSPSQNDVDEDKRRIIVEREPGDEEDPMAEVAGIERLPWKDGLGPQLPLPGVR